MPPAPPPTNPHTALDIEEPYHSSSDSDFDPSAAATEAPHLSESSDEHDNGDGDRNGKEQRERVKRRRKGTGDGDGDGDGDGFGALDSGDEATVRKGRKRRRRKGGKGKGEGEGAVAGMVVGEGDEEEGEEEEGGEGGLVKTRAQRAREGKERKPLASVDSATVDVDALWRDMNVKKGPVITKAVQEKGIGTVVENGIQPGPTHPTPAPKSNAPSTAEEMVAIKRTYVFAGETITEEKQVPKNSAEARLYLQSLQEANGSPATAPTTKPPLRRPKKRSSMFEPNPEGTVKGLTPTSGSTSANKGLKLNTIEKSKLDWAGFVDKEGIQEELDGAGKAKEGYLGRMDFLGRVEAKREEEVKGARKK